MAVMVCLTSLIIPFCVPYSSYDVMSLQGYYWQPWITTLICSEMICKTQTARRDTKKIPVRDKKQEGGTSKGIQKVPQLGGAGSQDSSAKGL